MSMEDPGLDRHEWETQYAALEEDLRDDPEQALPALADLVGGMVAEREMGEGDEIAAEYESARETALRCERGEADPGDVGAAIEGLRRVYETVLAERSTP